MLASVACPYDVDPCIGHFQSIKTDVLLNLKKTTNTI